MKRLPGLAQKLRPAESIPDRFMASAPVCQLNPRETEHENTQSAEIDVEVAEYLHNYDGGASCGVLGPCGAARSGLTTRLDNGRKQYPIMSFTFLD